MAEGQEPGDKVWRSAVKEEAAVGGSEEPVALLLDTQKAFEVIQCEHLVQEAVALR